MKEKKIPHIDLLNEVLRYEASSGNLYWAKSLGSARKGGKISGKCNGYLRVGINGNRYYAHRVIYKMVHGIEPEHIDHVNGNRSDNRIKNLRSVTRSENQRNQKIRKDNSSGCIGVHYNIRSKSYYSCIYNQGYEYLGTFKSLKEAIKVRKDAETRFGYHKNHGRITA